MKLPFLAKHLHKTIFGSNRLQNFSFFYLKTKKSGSCGLLFAFFESNGFYLDAFFVCAALAPTM